MVTAERGVASAVGVRIPSLSVEEKFYLLWPATIVMVGLAKARNWAIVSFLAAPLVRAVMHIAMLNSPLRFSHYTAISPLATPLTLSAFAPSVAAAVSQPHGTGTDELVSGQSGGRISVRERLVLPDRETVHEAQAPLSKQRQCSGGRGDIGDDRSLPQSEPSSMALSTLQWV